ncbi:MAG: fibronectin type III domain-containing protein [Paludibacteraceae bacterium]
MKKTLRFLSIIVCSLVFATNAWGADGDVLATCSGTGSGYGTRRTSIDANGIGWVLSTGQSGYLGTNNATNHNKVKPTAVDLPVVQAVLSSATTSTTGYYFYYTTTALANVGSLEFSYTDNSGSTSATAYIVVGDALAVSGGAAYTQVDLSASSTASQGVSLGTSGTFIFTFAETQTAARYYGIVIATASTKRMTGGKITIKEGAVSAYTITAVANPAEGGMVSVNGTKIIATPNDGYQIDAANPYTVTPSGSATVSQNGNEFTVTPTANCTIQINFAKLQEHTITWMVNGKEYKTTTTTGKIVLPTEPAAPSSCSDKKFMGWTTSSTVNADGTGITYIDENTTISANVTYYAVFATAESGGGTSKTLDITISNFTEITTSYTTTFTHNYADATVEAYGVYKNSNGIQMNSGKGTYIKNTTSLAGPITNITCTWTATGKNSPTIYVAKDKVASSSSVSLEKQSSTITTQSIDVNGADGYNYFYFDGTTVTGACYLKSLKITYGGVAKYTDYTTTCEECTDLVVTWNEMTATVNGQHGATLSWTATPTTNIAGYRVRVWSNASEVYNKTFDVTTTMLTLNDLLRDTWYRWEVTALPKDGSGFCPVTSSEGATFKTEGAIKLAAPTNPLVVYNEATNNYTFSWDAVANATKYTMRGQFSGDMGKNTTSSTRTLANLIPGKKYTVYVKAVGDGGDYTDSDEASYEFTAHTYTLTLSVMENGVPTTNTYTVPKYTLSAATSSCDEYTFAGWSETALTDPTTTAPTLIAAGTEYGPNDGYIKSDKTLYAVFSKTEEDGDGKYHLVTDASSLAAGDVVLLGNAGANKANGAMNEATGSYLKAVDVTISNGEFDPGTAAVSPITLGGNATDGWTLTNSQGKLYVTSDNNAKMGYSSTNTTTWTISIASGGTANITNSASTTRPINYNTSSPRFTNYAVSSNQSSIELYKLSASTITYTSNPECVDCTEPGADCPKYPIFLNDRGDQTELGAYWKGEQVPEPTYTPQGACAGYEFAGWTTEQGLDNLTEAEWENKKISFPYRMPLPADADAGITFYAMYKSTVSDEYQLVTTVADLTTGEYVLTASNGGNKYALSFVRSELITEFGSKEATFEEGSNTVIVTKDPEIIWTLTNVEGGYTLEALHFDGMQKQAFLNINDQYMMFEETARPYTISASGSKFTFCSAAEGGACMVFNGSTFEAGETATPLYLYKRVQDIRYTATTACDPTIISVGTVTVTSAQGIWVEAVTQPYIFAERLTQNRDNAASVDIIAESLTPQFTLKAVGAQGSGTESLTLKSGETRDNFADRFMVVYKPTGRDVIDNGEIAVRVTKAGDPTTVYAKHIVKVQGRSLPEEFVIAAQATDGSWVALPADLGTSSLATLKYPYHITVDNAADPTKATAAPETAIYTAAARFHENTNPRGVRLVNRSGMSLCGDYTKDPDHRLWLSEGEVVNSQSWALRSLRLKDYYIRLQASPAGHYLFYNATIGNGKIGYYEYLQQNRLRLRLLPVEVVCVRYDAPAVQVGQLKSTSVTLTWPYVKDMPGYEYTLDGGATWTAFVEDVNWTVEGATNIGTIEGLTAKGTYTVSVRVVAPEGRENCSDEGTRTFSLPECDDAPHNLWATATADAVHIMWEADAATATVKIYSDEAGTAVVTTQTNVASPCKITGLTQNTKYWYQVFADGTCASAIASFTTESSDISIVEWKKDTIIVDINTEVGTGVDLVVEKRTETSDGNIAEDIFFSKYFEAASNMKLLAIYNGTKGDIDISNVRIRVLRGLSNETGNYPEHIVPLKNYVSDKTIHQGQEIVMYSYQPSVTRDKAILNCIKEKEGFDTWIAIPYTYSETAEALVFGGSDAILLERLNTETNQWEPIDLIGAVEDDTYARVDRTNCDKSSFGDGNGWNCADGKDLDGNVLALSTNRCLLIRDKDAHCVSGKNAVQQNIGDFNTLCTEWKGRHVKFYEATGSGSNKDYTKDNEESCEGFSSVAGFDYNNYYITYEKINEVKFTGTPNPNGTYTIEVDGLSELACTDIRLQLTKGEEVTASREQKVPIIVYENANTNTVKFFHADGLDAAVCADCDVVVRDHSTLTNVSEEGAIQQFRDMFIYHDSRLEIPEGTHMKLDKLRMFALNDDVSYAIINNADGETPAISINEISHVKRIDGKYWYPFSLPYNCRIADIGALNGKDLGTYGVDWGIKYYDGQKRQRDGKSASIGGVSDYWYMMGKDDLLEAYKGYIIGLFVPASEEANQKSINFAPANIKPYTETAESKTTLVQNWPDNLEAAPRHHGWNFTGSPYISLFGVVPGQGLYNAQLKMGWTDIYGKQQDNGNIYISIPDGGNSRTYTQSLASGITVKPFTAYFVQTIDPQDGSGHTLELTYNKAHRRLPQPQQMPNMTLMPSRAAEETSVLFAELTITAEPADGQTKVLTDNAGVQVNDRFSADYEIGYDLTKMYAAADKPQLYTVAADNEKMAYNALPDALAHSIPLGIYLPKAGDYTLSLNRNVSSLEDAESVCLLHNGVVVADLLHADYTIVATAKGEQAGYMLDIRRTPQVITSAETVGQDAPYALYNNGMLTIGNLPSDANLQIYDVLGRLIWNEQHIDAASSVVVPASQTGVYMIVVDSDAAPQQYILKSLVR